MKEPLDHILRPRLPWREGEGAITECGYDASKVKTLTRDDFVARMKELGQQRTAMITCMTCSNTSRRWADWDADPRRAIEREISWECDGGYRASSERGERLKTELIAIAALVAAHHDEFQSSLALIDRQREWLLQKAARETRVRGQQL